jgi:hypothetical protein
VYINHFVFFIYSIFIVCTTVLQMGHNGHLQVVVADFEERQCPQGHDGQERSRDNWNSYTHNAIYKMLNET